MAGDDKLQINGHQVTDPEWTPFPRGIDDFRVVRDVDGLILAERMRAPHLFRQENGQYYVLSQAKIDGRVTDGPNRICEALQLKVD